MGQKVSDTIYAYAILVALLFVIPFGVVVKSIAGITYDNSPGLSNAYHIAAISFGSGIFFLLLFIKEVFGNGND